MIKPQVFLCDIDGTIALRGERGPYDFSLVIEDAPRPHMADILHALAKSYKIIYVSGRKQHCRPATEYWLGTHQFPFSDLIFMRADNDDRADSIIKAEILTTQIFPYFTVIGVFDDRSSVVNMWRKHKLLCFQVDSGNF